MMVSADCTMLAFCLQIFAMDDKSEQDAREVEAESHNLNYVGLDGNIGCLGKLT